jgi:hypothetical protein
LVALLTISDRKDEAESIAQRAKEVWNSQQLAAELESALKGNIPPPWP